MCLLIRIRLRRRPLVFMTMLFICRLHLEVVVILCVVVACLSLTRLIIRRRRDLLCRGRPTLFVYYYLVC